MPFRIVEGDITEQGVDAIVNAANPQLQMGGGVCGAIFRAAGPEKLQAECDSIGGIDTGEAVMTGGYALPAPHIIHTAGPVWYGGGRGEEALLKNSYKNSLALAGGNGLRSIAFPLISSGIYGYPRREALDAAVSAIREYLDESDADIDVRLVLLNRDDLPYDEKLGGMVARYLGENQKTLMPAGAGIVGKSRKRGIIEHCDSEDARVGNLQYMEELGAPYVAEQALVGYADEPGEFEVDESFAERLRRRLIERGVKKDSEIYKKANITKDVWSKIFSVKDRVPSKRTAVAIAVALGLNLDQAKDLLLAAGYALSQSFLFDLIVIYCIENGVFDIYRINEILFKYEQPLLGSFPGD